MGQLQRQLDPGRPAPLLRPLDHERPLQFGTKMTTDCINVAEEANPLFQQMLVGGMQTEMQSPIGGRQTDCR